MLDEVDVVTGVSGGSFTALAYGLYGDRLFDGYEQDFLKRDVEATLLRRLIDPMYWGDLWSTGWGRSELAARYYDEILFHGATFGDLQRVCDLHTRVARSIAANDESAARKASDELLDYVEWYTKRTLEAMR